MSNANIMTTPIASQPQKPESWYLAVRHLHTWLEMDDGTVAHPFVLLLINLDLEIISGLEILPNQPNGDQMIRFLHKIIQDPPKETSQDPHRPKCVLLETKEMASLLRSGLEELEIEVDYQLPPPHIAQLIAEIEDMLRGSEPDPPGLLSADGVTPTMVADLFSAAVDYYRASPWEFLSDIQPLKVHFIQISKDAYIQLMGHAGLEYGLIMYWDWQDLIHTYITADDPLEQVPLGGWRSLTFENADLIPWEDLNAIEEYGWKIAGENAYPLAITYTRTAVERPTPEEIIFYEAILRAIPIFVDEFLIPDDIGDYEPVEAYIEVKTHKGLYTLVINYPAGDLPDELLVSIDEFDMERGALNLIDIKPPIELPPKLGEIEKAQQIIELAWKESDSERRIDLAHQALSINPDCADAYVLIAKEHAETLEEAHHYFLQGVYAGERALGDSLSDTSKWGNLDILHAGPYFRARVGLAECEALLGNHESAIQHCQDILTLNPDDHFDVRYTLMSLLLRTRRTEEVKGLLVLFADDTSTEWQYSRALLTFLEHGDSPQAQTELRKSIELNIHIPKYLSGRVSIPDQIPSNVEPGSDAEAIEYVHDHYLDWWATSGAIEWLKKTSDARD